MYFAALDTCVLWPSLQRDFLLQLVVEDVYRAVWSDVTLDELEYAERDKLIRRGRSTLEATQRAKRLISEMASAFDNATIPDWDLIQSLGLPDPNDEHVVAAAIMGRADVIVTENHRHFPPELLPAGLTTTSAAPFIDDMCSVSPAAATRALVSMSARRRNPPTTPTELLADLRRKYGIDTAVDAMSGWL